MVAAGKGTVSDMEGNDGADVWAKDGVRKHETIDEEIKELGDMRCWAIRTHLMMLEIVIKRAEVLSERQNAELAKKEEERGQPKKKEDAMPLQGYAGMEMGVEQLGEQHYEGMRIQPPLDVKKWPWGGEVLNAVTAWASKVTWIPEASVLPSGQRHTGTAWAELTIDFELVTGKDVPLFHRPRKPRDTDPEGPAPLGLRARAFARCIAAAGRLLGVQLMPSTAAHRVRSLASFGLPPMSGFKSRAVLVGGLHTVSLIKRTLSAVDMIAQHRSTRKGVGKKKAAVGAWGDKIWIPWEDAEVERGDLLPTEKEEEEEGPASDDEEDEKAELVIPQRKDRASGKNNPWVVALGKARAFLKTEGFVAVKKGTPLYNKAKEFMQEEEEPHYEEDEEENAPPEAGMNGGELNMKFNVKPEKEEEEEQDDNDLEITQEEILAATRELQQEPVEGGSELFGEDVLAPPHEMRAPRRRKIDMSREPLPAAKEVELYDEDESGEEDFIKELNDEVIGVPNGPKKSRSSGGAVTVQGGKKRPRRRASWAWPEVLYPVAKHPWCIQPPTFGNEARMKPKIANERRRKYQSENPIVNWSRKEYKRKESPPRSPSPPPRAWNVYGLQPASPRAKKRTWFDPAGDDLGPTAKKKGGVFVVQDGILVSAPVPIERPVEESPQQPCSSSSSSSSEGGTGEKECLAEVKEEEPKRVPLAELSVEELERYAKRIRDEHPLVPITLHWGKRVKVAWEVPVPADEKEEERLAEQGEIEEKEEDTGPHGRGGEVEMEEEPFARPEKGEEDWHGGGLDDEW